jgi:photosystem II stability/assembly factor-like uncharacterized protein
MFSWYRRSPALEKQRRQRQEGDQSPQQLESGGANWSPTGLLDVYANCLAVDPTDGNVVFAALRGGGVSRGGVFKSTDGGESWSPTAITDITSVVAIDPTNPNTVYAGTTEIFKSTDGGNTWSAVNQGLTKPGAVLSIVVDPRNPNTVYAGTGGGCFKSTDGGQTWSLTGLKQFFSESPGGLAIDPINDATLYAAAGPGPTVNARLYKSTDGGAHWSQSDAGLTDPAVFCVTVNPVTPTTVYAGTFQTSVFVSHDSGQTWQ